MSATAEMSNSASAASRVPAWYQPITRAMTAARDLVFGATYDAANQGTTAQVDAAANTSSRPAVLVITQLDVWALTAKRGIQGAGNQDMYNTLLGYVDAGYDVHVLTSGSALSEMTRVGEHIVVHRMGLPVYPALQRFKAWRAALGGASSGAPSTAKAGTILQTGHHVPFWLAFQWGAMFHALRLRLRGKYALVYGYEVFGAPIAYVLARLWRVPVVTRFQGTELSPLLKEPRTLRRKFWSWLLSYRVPADLVVMANDGTEGDLIMRHIGQDMRRVGFWMNGVDKSRVRRPDLNVAEFRSQWKIPTDHAFVLTSVRLVDWKRHDRALKALALVRKRTDKFTYVIVGDGPLRATLEKMASDLGVAERVTFTGSMPHDRVMDFVNACDIYLSVNDLSNLGNPLIEATLCERCIVTLNNGATRDLITHDVNGLMLPPDDTGAMADALHRMITSPSQRDRLREGARRRAESLQTWSDRMRLELATLHRITRGKTLPPGPSS